MKQDHYLPQVAVFFLSKKWIFNGPAPVEVDENTKDIIKVETPDIISFNTNIGLSKSPGTFSLTINNKDLRYMIADNPQEDIELLVANDSNYEESSLWKSYSEYEKHVYSSKIWKDKDGKIYLVGGDGKIIKEEGSVSEPVKDAETKSYPGNLEYGKNSAFEKFYGGKEGMKRGTCIFKPMQRVSIWASKRFPTNEERSSEEVMVPIFTGLVDKVTVNYSENYDTIQISGKDVTKWLQISQININPVLVGDNMQATADSGVKLWDNLFSGMGPADIISKLVVGGMVNKESGGVTTGDVLVPGMGQFIKKVETFLDKDNDNSVPRPPIEKKGYLTNMIGERREDIIQNKLRLVIPPESKDWQPFKMANMSMNNNLLPELQFPLDICYEVAKKLYFEFYADATGDIWFCPPRFSNRWILSALNPRVYMINPEDIISYNLTETDQVKTAVFITASRHYLDYMNMPGIGGPDYKRIVDNRLMKKYGFRLMSAETTCVQDLQGVSLQDQLARAANGILQRVNAEIYTAHITMPARAEIQVGHPIYFSLHNMVYYITGVSHAYEAGGSFLTTLELNYGRKPWEVLDELIPFTDSRKKVQLGETMIYTPKSTFGTDKCTQLINTVKLYGAQIKAAVNAKTPGSKYITYDWVLAFMLGESGGDKKACSESPACGLMQIDAHWHEGYWTRLGYSFTTWDFKKKNGEIVKKPLAVVKKYNEETVNRSVYNSTAANILEGVESMKNWLVQVWTRFQSREATQLMAHVYSGYNAGYRDNFSWNKKGEGVDYYQSTVLPWYNLIISGECKGGRIT